MIVKMKKLTLFIRETGRKQTLEALRKLGAVHLKAVKQAYAADLGSVSSQLEQAGRAAHILRQYKQPNNLHKSVILTAGIQQRIEKILSLYDQQKVYEQDLEKISQQIEWYKIWGGFDPHDIDKCAGKGIHIRLYQITTREYQQVQARADIYVVRQEKGYVYIAQITYGKEDKLSFKSVTLPDEAFDTLCAKHEQLKKEIAKIYLDLQAEASIIKDVNHYYSLLEKKHEFLKAMHGMEQEQGFAYIQGYIPRDRCDELVALAGENSAGYFLEEPDEQNDVPTLIRNPKWIDIISPVFKFMSTVPGYKEYDISAWFLIFFSLFFAMLVGDAGYGIIFLVAAFIMHKRLKHIPSQPFFLMYALSTATIIWGAITGTWFGAEKIAQLPLLSHLVVQDISSFAADNQSLMIFICFTIGIIHLTIAHVIVGLKVINSLKALAELGWVLVLWALYFVAGMLVIARPMPAYTLGLLSAGVVLLLFFSEPQKNMLKAVGLSLANIPLKIVSSFSDIVSYLRLFAVGCATVVLASTFNDMVAGIGFNSVISGLVTALILFLGHALNIALAFMAVIVHGIRLNMLEFSGQMGMS
jgi:V/A-type H+/Na+-transporting ATPase subunit I